MNRRKKQSENKNKNRKPTYCTCREGENANIFECTSVESQLCLFIQRRLPFAFILLSLFLGLLF